MKDPNVGSELALWQAYCDKKMECESLSDTITWQEKVISELEILVESAYREGYIKGFIDAKADGLLETPTNELDYDECWDLSDSNAELTKHKQS